jgi:NAD(P)-dependent dehydrogenase (short-subunit alcohol dehydrogenase family)
MRFEGRTVVLTGVGREGQVGEALAAAFAAEGASLVLVDRMGDELARRADAVRLALRPGARVTPVVCDLTDASDVERMAAAARDAGAGSVHAVVCAAGGFAMSGPVADSDPSILGRMIAINLVTAYLTTRAFVPLLRPARGALLYFASAAALPDASGARMSAYAASKSGLLALMRAVADEERDAGVRANAVAPTSIRTRDNVAAMGDSGSYVERESVADVALFLCSDLARNVTGQIVRLA